MRAGGAWTDGTSSPWILQNRLPAHLAELVAEEDLQLLFVSVSPAERNRPEMFNSKTKAGKNGSKKLEVGA